MARLASELPGEDLIAKGLQDLKSERSSVESLLVLIGAPRLRRLGVLIPSSKKLPESPEHTLYRFLQREDSRDAHSRYNALIRRLVSYERALESYFFR